MFRSSHTYVETREDDEYYHRFFSITHHHLSKLTKKPLRIRTNRTKFGNGLLVDGLMTMSDEEEVTADFFPLSLHAPSSLSYEVIKNKSLNYT